MASGGPFSVASREQLLTRPAPTLELVSLPLSFPHLSPSFISPPLPIGHKLGISLNSQEGCRGDGVDYQRSEDVIRLLQSTQQNIEQQYAVLHCTGFIRLA